MRIGILAPVATADVAHLLQDGGRGAPQGYPGAPFIATLIETFLEQGHEVVAFTSDRTLDPSGNSVVLEGFRFRLWLCPARPNGTIPRIQSPVGRIWDLFRVERRYLAQAVAKERTDILHAHWTYEFALVAIQSGRPCLVTIHDSPGDVLRLSPTPYTFGRYLMARKVLRTQIPLTAVSPYVARMAIGRTNRPPILLIANPLPLWLKKITEKPTVSDTPSTSRTVIMVLGTWSPVKNPLPGIQAFINFANETDQAIKLDLYGADYAPNGKAARELRRSHVNMKNINLCGQLGHRQLIERVRKASVLLHTSMTESFGMAVAEAMALGVPVIAGQRSGAMPWLLQNGKAGQLVDVQNINEIKTAIQIALDRPAVVRKQIRFAQITTWNFANSDAVASEYLSAYKRVMG